MARWWKLVLVFVSVVAASLVSCGAPQLSQQQVCGGQPCDACVGAFCGADAGTDGGTP